ncbi:MAG: tRNA (adenosine(37)-N6)-threonylcarbamoyltransferase complex dimerization subunit type 1 TsaB [Qingshengfaniella sp.]
MTGTTLLAFDTSAAHCSAAVLRGDRLLASRTEAMSRGQAERLISLLDEVLAEGDIPWEGLDGLGVGIGPGNFTGIRIAVAAARGLALALNRPAIGISGLEAAAFALPRPITAVLPAPRGRAYVQRFGPDSPPTLVDSLPPGETPLTGPGAAALAGTRPVVPQPVPLTEAIARIAVRQLGTPHPRPAPLYLRPADAAPARDAPPVILS